MFKNALKQDLRLIATEINEKITEKMTVAELNNVILNSDLYKKDPNQVISIGNSIIEERKSEEQRQLEIERIRLERAKAELELEQLKKESKSSEFDSEKNHELCSLETLIKSVRTLTLKLPSKPEGWGLFFSSLERAFISKSVPNKYKAEILLNLLGEKACNIITYLKEDEIEDYERVKLLILREFEPTPQACLEQFRKATRLQGETCVQFASRLKTNWDYYLKLKKVSDFDSLNQLIVADRIFQTLDKETASHISIRQADEWFNPLKLSQEVDLYSTSRGKPENYNAFRKYPNAKNVSKVFFSDVKNSKCVLCFETHPLHKCTKYKLLSVNERLSVVKNNNLCFNCLYRHRVSQCKSKYRCSNCSKSHHNSLCFSQGKNANVISEKKNEVKLEPSDNYGSANTHKSVTQEQILSPFSAEFKSLTNSELQNKLFTTRSSDRCKIVLLSTTNCFIRDEMGNIHKLRCLLDNGSMCNLMTHQCAERIGLKREKINKVLSTLNDVPINVKSKVNTTLMNGDMSFQTNLDFLIVSRITDSFIPSERLNINKEEFNKIKLADENFDVPGNIDALLGAETFYEILMPGQLYPLNTKLILQNSIFGYIVSGNVTPTNVQTIHCGLVKESIDLDKTLKRFWELENLDKVTEGKSRELVICDEHYQKTHRRDKAGRYIVQMPLKDNPSCLGKSKERANHCLNYLWARISKKPQMLALYKAFMQEYIDMNHMEEVKEENEPENCYYMPHHAVFRAESNSTPLRVVFNAASPTSSGKSLNCIQYKGGVIQSDLFTIMLRFRKNQIAFVADIQKMYRMILIDTSQRDLLRILWKFNESDDVKVFRLSTVTYGTSSAPYLATRTLQQLAVDEGKNFPLASSVLLSDVYMDDILTGAKSLSEARELQRQLIALLNRGGMKLHKWAVNDQSLLCSDNTKGEYSFIDETKALGNLWKTKTDCLGFNFTFDKIEVYTKRIILSQIAKLFDPIGILGPLISRAKIFMQKLWILDLGWDDQLPEKEATEWEQFCISLRSINKIEVERCIIIKDATRIELHGFSDSSESAYGAVIYCKSYTSSGGVAIKLVTSKSRVAPVKRVTIPRLELCGAVLLARLIDKVRSALNVKLSDVYLWSDSMIVLWWLRKEPYKLKTFIANRVAVILELTDTDQWRHVPSEENPADLLSRGALAEKLLQSEMWFKGPKFLTEDEYPEKEIPQEIFLKNISSELKTFSDSNVKNVLTLNVNTFINEFINITNDYAKLIRILGYIYRFFRNCKGEKRNGPLQSAELREGELVLISVIQKIEFKKEFSNLAKKGSVLVDSQVKNLLPFKDERGVLRVGGRLSHSKLNFDKKFPIILPKNHRVTDLIIEMYHKRYFHVGPQTLLFLIREKFWPING